MEFKLDDSSVIVLQTTTARARDKEILGALYSPHHRARRASLSPCLNFHLMRRCACAYGVRGPRGRRVKLTGCVLSPTEQHNIPQNMSKDVTTQL